MEISLNHAKTLAINAQFQPLKSGIKGTHEMISHLGYVQIDSISVIDRAHHHILNTRITDYKHEYLQKLVKSKKIFEYWSHAAAYIPMSDYRFYLVKMNHYATKEKTWFPKDHKIRKEVIKRIHHDGPLKAQDFEHKRLSKSLGWWDWKPAKQALEQLYLEGELMVSREPNFQKVYDLTERVLPEVADLKTPSEMEYATYLILKTIRSHGIASISDINFFNRNPRVSITPALKELLAQKKLIAIKIKGIDAEYYTSYSQLNFLNEATSDSNEVKILSPFDNLVINRKRLKTLFDFEYQLECYIPQEKRLYGYFCLPLLYGNEFFGRIDLKADRGNKTLLVQNIFFEEKFKKTKIFQKKLSEKIKTLAEFSLCQDVVYVN